MNLQVPVLVEKVLNYLQEHNFEIYIVGGSVRDVLLDKQVKDWDFTTNAKPEQLQELFPESFYDNGFGTVGVTVEELIAQFSLQNYEFAKEGLELGDVFEITTYRTEGTYSDFRRPDEVAWGETIEDDLKRRDFTINALALSKKNGEFELIDLFGGQEDLKQKQIKAVGDPKLRFSEDALRMLRAVRLAAQLGFLIEANTLSAIKDNAPLLKHISGERIRDELLKMLVAPYFTDGMKLMLATGLLHYVLPEMEETVGVEQAGHHTKDVWHHSLDAAAACPSPDPIIRLATLIHDSGKAKAYRKQNGKITFYGHEVVSGRLAKKIGERLHLSNRDKERLFILVRYHMFAYNPEMTDAAIRRFIRKIGLENINDMMMLRIGDRVGGGSRQTSWRLRELQQRIGQVLYTPMQIKDLKVSGHDVMEILGISGGPKVGEILNILFEEVMENSNKNDRDYLLGRIKEFSNFEEDTSS
ncbi:HD domain-containing protein [Candidatus Beckwithbacteria bacterium]|nr:HD domain-containing protein [Candidatus Beckwithbacteria bacterium]